MNISRLIYILQEECHITQDALIAVGVSGGADSICLLNLLYQAGHPVAAFHFNHQIRSEANDDAAFVEKFCRERSISCEIGTANVPEFASEEHLSLEEAARILRYRFLFKSARKWHAAAIATAHHADDQVETVLMHFIRGSGLSGLKGMKMRSILVEFDPTIPIIRPLLYTRKQEILSYCNEHDLPFVFDQTNLDNTYFRNWLRNDLIPIIEQHNPRFQEAIQRTSIVLSADEEILEDAIDDAWQACLIHSGKDYLQFNVSMMREQKIGLLRGLARRAIGGLRPGLRDIDFVDVDRFCRFIPNPPGTHRIDLVAGLEVRMAGEIVTIGQAGVFPPVLDYPQLIQSGELTIPGEYRCNPYWLIRSEILNSMAIDFDRVKTAPPGEAWLDAEKVSGKMTIRFFQPGDRLEVLGAGGHTGKLSDVFINHKIPSAARTAYPLVWDSTRIIWLPGVRICHSCRITAQTRQVLHLSLIKQDLS
jgi:tRNA(Ile)-lysidine synthase